MAGLWLTPQGAQLHTQGPDFPWESSGLTLLDAQPLMAGLG